MASLLPTLSRVSWRLNLLQKPTVRKPIRAFKALQIFPSRPKLPPLYSSSPLNSSPPHLFSSNSSTSTVQMQNPLFSDDNLVILGIETSCDDTAAAVVRSNGEILSQVVSSQADLLARYGGVAPKMAEEAHAQVIDQVVQEALDKAKLTEKDLSAVAVTIGPGLSLCLRVGVQKARKIAGTFNLPIVGVHHMEAHALVASLIFSPLFLEEERAFVISESEEIIECSGNI